MTASNGVDEEWRSQEDAEKAGLMPLVADDPDAALACGIGLCLNPARGRDAEGYAACIEHLPTVPVPLDPSNPDDLRRWLEDAHAIEQQHGLFAEMVRYNSPFARLAAIAEGLDRERAEQAQEADRKLAEAVVAQVYADTDGAFVAKGIIALAAIRAERARASAKGGAS